MKLRSFLRKRKPKKALCYPQQKFQRILVSSLTSRDMCPTPVCANPRRSRSSFASRLSFLSRLTKLIDTYISDKPFGPEDTVLCHWDISEKNVLIDPETHRATGLIDWEQLVTTPVGFQSSRYPRIMARDESCPDYLDSSTPDRKTTSISSLSTRAESLSLSQKSDSDDAQPTEGETSTQVQLEDPASIKAETPSQLESPSDTELK